MPEQRNYPPLDDPARYDQILRRGRTLRRRRQLGVGAGAGGGVAAVALAVVLLTGSSDGADRQVVADDDRVAPIETTTTTTTTTTTAPPPPEQLTVQVDTDGDEIVVVVTDPDFPVTDEARQCVLLTLSGADAMDISEIHTCDDVAVDGMVEVDLPVPTGVQIGCAAVMLAPTGEPAPEYVTELRSTTFRFEVPDGTAPGDRPLTVSATSGVGDGCAYTGDDAPAGETLPPGVTERYVEHQGTVTLG